jgi:5-methylcytosine-specific restriction endonuclease McrA
VARAQRHECEDDVTRDRAACAILNGRELRAYIVRMPNPIETLSNRDLVDAVGRLSTIERSAIADLIEALAEFDARRLYLAEGFSSLFAYCTARLGLSEHEAYHRIEAARAAKRFPVVLERLRGRALTLTAVGLLRPHLTDANCLAVLDAAHGRSKREIEELVAGLSPRPDVATSIRKVSRKVAGTDAAPIYMDREAEPSSAASDIAASWPRRTIQPAPSTAPTPPTPPTSAIPLLVSAGAASTPTVTAAVSAIVSAAERPSRPGTIRPLAPARYHLQLTVDEPAHTALRQLQDLLRTEVPNGDPALIVGCALTFLLAHVQRRKFAADRRCNAAAANRRANGGAPSPHIEQPVRSKRRARTSEAPDATETLPPPGGPVDANAGSHASAHHERDADPELEAPLLAQAVPGARYIPAAIRRAVWTRDEGRCTFVGNAGRCPERAALEFHHRVPLGRGGTTTVENLALACKGHNQWQADLDYGEEAMRAHRARSG